MITDADSGELRQAAECIVRRAINTSYHTDSEERAHYCGGTKLGEVTHPLASIHPWIQQA